LVHGDCRKDARSAIELPENDCGAPTQRTFHNHFSANLVFKNLFATSGTPMSDQSALPQLPPSVLRPDAPDKPEEACGVYGVYGKHLDAAKLTYFGLYALQHRGQESAGIAAFDGHTLHLHKEMGLVSQVFDEESLHALPGSIAVGHTRYSTTGSSRVANAQPVVVDTHQGPLALAHNGNLVNTIALRDRLLAANWTLETSTDSELIAYNIAEHLTRTESLPAAVIAACRECEGAFSLVIGTAQELIAIRDPHGIRPLVIGVLPIPDGEEQVQYVFASETCGLDIVGATYLRDVEPGELVVVNETGLHAQSWIPETERKLCIFEMIYFARPDSQMHGESLYSYRMRLGEYLAKESLVDADLVMAVPDSGVPAAIGFSQKSGIPYAEGLIKNRYVGRTFIQPTQEMRERGIRVKLNPLRDVLEGKRIIIVDDSIVRGTTSRKIVQALREAGATEVHMRISSPPVTHPCFYGIDTDNQEQLIAATKSVAEIAATIGVDSLCFLSWEGMLEATRNSPQSFCSACFTGDYPVAIPEVLKRSKLMLETAK
jgi:amidophosphoribosyltransferase